MLLSEAVAWSPGACRVRQDGAGRWGPPPGCGEVSLHLVLCLPPRGSVRLRPSSLGGNMVCSQ